MKPNKNHLTILGLLLLAALGVAIVYKLTLGFRKHIDSVHVVVSLLFMGFGMVWLLYLSIFEDKDKKSAFKYLLFICLQILFSIAYIVIFQQSFGFKKHLIPLHLLMVGALMGSAILLMGALVRIERFQRWRPSRYVLSAIPATVSISLFILYIVDYVVNKMGAKNITYDVFGMYLLKPNDIAHLLPLSIYYIYILLFMIIVFIYALHMKYSSIIYEGISDFVLPGRGPSLFLNNKRTIISTLLISISCLAFIFVMMKYFNKSKGIFWAGEPITNFVVYWSPIGNDPHRVAVANEDRRVRVAYRSRKYPLKKNVVVIIVDSLRADHMSIYGYGRKTTPFLKSMLDQGKLMKVKFAISTCPETAGGVLSTLASRNFRSLADYNFKLNELLRDQGYKAYFIHSGDQTYYQRLRWYFGKEIDLFFDGNNSKLYSANDDRVIFEGLGKVPEHGDTPAFFYFHLMSTHILGVRHEEFDLFKPSKLDADYVKLLDNEYDHHVLVNRYDDGVLQSDSVIKDIFKALNEKGYLSDSIIFILADHGDGLGEHGHNGHDHYVYQEDIGIPMLIYDPGEPPYANLEFASQPDVAVTILDRLHLPIPSTWQGRSLLNPEIKEFIYSQTRNDPPLISIIYRNGDIIYKYIQGPKKEDLYELTKDPGEHNNLVQTADPALIRRMRSQISQGSSVPAIQNSMN